MRFFKRKLVDDSLALEQAGVESVTELGAQQKDRGGRFGERI